MDANNPFRCYNGRFLVESLIAALIVVALAFLGRGQPRGSAVRIAIGAGQAVAFGLLIVRMSLALRALDELQRHIHLVAIAVSFTATAVVVVGADFLRKSGVPVPLLGTELWVLMTTVWGLTVSVLARRYR